MTYVCFINNEGNTQMTTYRIIADTARTFALRNEATGQIDHGQFLTVAEVRSFYRAQFSWDPSYRLEG